VGWFGRKSLKPGLNNSHTDRSEVTPLGKRKNKKKVEFIWSIRLTQQTGAKESEETVSSYY
jgi:hypothetical protein